MKETIFFIEDDASINALIGETLRLSGYEAKGFLDPLDFLEAAKTCVPDLLVLDLMLPHMSGYDVITYMHGDDKLSRVPVIILSALSDERDIVKGLDDGAIDYVTKPFGVAEFVARIKANLRKGSRLAENRKGSVKARDLVIDRDKHTCTLKGSPVVLTAKEFQLVSILAENVGNVVERNELLREIWGYDANIETRTLDMHVKTIREKFAAVTDEEYIVTVRAVGYVIYDED